MVGFPEVHIKHDIGRGQGGEFVRELPVGCAAEPIDRHFLRLIQNASITGVPV